MQNHNYILLMAGGSGTRLYPASRESKPKHLSKIIGKTTLLQQTYSRAAKVVSKENIFICTNAKYINQILEQLPEIKKEQIIAEPERKNTAPAMALGTTIITNIDPEALVAAISCDHQVLKEAVFVEAFKLGFDTISQNSRSILAIGIQPTSPETGYGYIEQDGLVEKNGNFKIFRVKQFIEKPDRPTAQKYLDSGNFFWNASYFIFKGEHFLEEVRKFLPEVHSGLQKIKEKIGSPKFEDALKKEFSKFADAQVDKAIMEKTSNMLVLPADLGWCDVGSWDTVVDLIEEKKKDENGNYCEGLDHVDVDSHNTVILGNSGGEKLIATIGLSNITIVDTKDVILIMEKGRGQEVKKIVEQIKKRKMDELL